jgi:hypothetical protein
MTPMVQFSKVQPTQIYPIHEIHPR